MKVKDNVMPILHTFHVHNNISMNQDGSLEF